MTLRRLPNRRLRLAFFGTPQIARTMLERVVDAGEDDVVLVVSQPDKPKGRGKQVEPTPTKELAVARGIPCEQPAKLKDGVLAAKMRELELDLAIVVAYGRILPEAVFAAPAAGTWNVHASLLPRHRGASPIQHAILEGDAETGVDLMELTAGLDEGAVLLEKKIALTGEETGGSLTEQLAVLGGEVLVEGLRLAKSQGLVAVEQDHARATYARILEKKDGLLDFTRPAAELERRVRALDPWPGAYVAQKDGQPIKITKAIATPPGSGSVPDSTAPGTIVSLTPLRIAAGSGALELASIQPPGKRPMPAADYLRGSGRHLQIGGPFPDC